MSYTSKLLGTLALALAAGFSGCAFSGTDPQVFHCSASQPACPAGQTCDVAQGICRASGGLDAKVDKRASSDGTTVSDRATGSDRSDGGADSQRVDSYKCPAPKPPSGLTPNHIVSASVGSDSTTDSLCIPFKTITQALKRVTSGQIIWVAPGIYNATLGEIFPLKLPDKVTLVGDETTLGGGTNPTSIDGHAKKDPGSTLTQTVTFFQAGPNGNSSIRGFRITGNSTTNDATGIDNNGLPMNIVSNLFTGSWGIDVSGSCPVISSNVFNNKFRGARLQCSGTDFSFTKNRILSGSFGIYITTGNGKVADNEFSNVDMPVQVDNDSPIFDNNVFSNSADFSYGAIRIYGGTPTVRNCVFKTGPAVRIDNASDPNLGNLLLQGKNDFTALSIALVHNGSAAVNAIGNTWKSGGGTPCSYIKFGSGATGSVTWSAGNTCTP